MKIFLFEEDAESLPVKKTGRKKKVKEKTISKAIDNINPMAFAVLSLKYQENPSNEFIKSSFLAISESPHKLTEKWVSSINKFIDSYIASAVLDPPDILVGERVDIGCAVIITICEPKMNSQYPTPAILASDERGWKFYFKTSKAYSFKPGQAISFRATVSSHKEGITFMSRASSIVTL